MNSLILHNAIQLSIPFWVIGLMLTIRSDLDLFPLFFFTILGGMLPDIDHLNMWGKVKHKGVVSFIKFCVNSDRGRKAFLPFHNYVSIAILAVVTPITMLVNPIMGSFLMAFLLHILFDFVTDVVMVKSHKHWRFRNWFADTETKINEGGQRVQE